MDNVPFVFNSFPYDACNNGMTAVEINGGDPVQNTNGTGNIFTQNNNIMEGAKNFPQ